MPGPNVPAKKRKKPEILMQVNEKIPLMKRKRKKDTPISEYSRVFGKSHNQKGKHPGSRGS